MKNDPRIVIIPNMDTSFMDDIMKGGVADSGISNDSFYFYNDKQNNEICEERLTRFGFNVEKIKEWSSNESND